MSEGAVASALATGAEYIMAGQCAGACIRARMAADATANHPQPTSSKNKTLSPI